MADLISLGGTALGFLTYMAMANPGLSAVFLSVPWLYIALKAGGSLLHRLPRRGSLAAG